MMFTIINVYNCNQHYVIFWFVYNLIAFCCQQMKLLEKFWVQWKQKPSHTLQYTRDSSHHEYVFKISQNLPHYNTSSMFGYFLRMNNILITLQVISETAISDERVGRSLLQAVAPEVKPPIMFNVSGGPCIMLWAQNLTVKLDSSSPWTDLAQQTPTLDGSLCNGSTSR